MRGDPTWWFQKESVNHGGDANQVDRRGAIGGGLEQPSELSELPRKSTGIEKLRVSTGLNALLKVMVTRQGQKSL